MPAVATDPSDDPPANVHLLVRERDERAKEIIEAFSDGLIVGVVVEGETLVVGLRMAGAAWRVNVSLVEARLDRLGFDWRRHARCVQPGD